MFRFLKAKETSEQRDLRFRKLLAKEEVEKAKQELEVATCHFNRCEPVFFEVANEQLTLAIKKLDVAIMKAKLAQ
jgi:hypothetical protein